MPDGVRRLEDGEVRSLAANLTNPTFGNPMYTSEFMNFYTMATDFADKTKNDSFGDSKTQNNMLEAMEAQVKRMSELSVLGTGQHKTEDLITQWARDRLSHARGGTLTDMKQEPDKPKVFR